MKFGVVRISFFYSQILIKALFGITRTKKAQYYIFGVGRGFEMITTRRAVGSVACENFSIES